MIRQAHKRGIPLDFKVDNEFEALSEISAIGVEDQSNLGIFSSNSAL